MLAEGAYLDTAFLFRLYWEDPGWESIREFAATQSSLVCAIHGRAELYSAAHRKRSEGAATDDAIAALLDQFDLDCRSRGLAWLSLTEAVLQRVESVYRGAPENLYLRAADALHLATAADFGYEQIYSNDRLLLSAATYFGLQGVNLLGAE